MAARILVLAYGDRYLQTQAGVSIAVDSLMVVVFAVYLFTRHQAPGTNP